MPVYSYACVDCGARFEQRQAFSDDPITECPTCGGTVRRRYDSIGVTFNGSGFYRTDSRSTSDAKGSKDSGSKSAGSKDSGSKDSGSSSSSTGSKPSPKPAATSGAPASGT